MKSWDERDTITEPARRVPVIDDLDVLVLGGGPAGIVAAVAAARNGAVTGLVEHYGFLGGMAASALVGPFAGVRHRYGGGRILGGIPWELILRMDEHGGVRLESYAQQWEGAPEATGRQHGRRGDVPFDAEILKWTAEQLAQEAGVRLRYHTTAVEVVKEGNGIRAVILESKSGRQAVTARTFVDCSGDADIAAMSGAPFESGRPEDGSMQPMSMIFRLGGVDTDTLWGDVPISPYLNRTARDLAKTQVDKGALPVFGGPWTCFGSTIRHGEVMVNMVRLWGDATDAEVLTRNEITAREHIRRFVAFLQENLPEFRNCHLLDTGAQIGIRETRRIRGEYRLTAEDILEGRRFEDSVALGGHVIDIHSPGRTYGQVRRQVAPYRIPYRCLVPLEVENLLVAGRPISSTHEAHASLRVMGTAMATGQAAGTAAALAFRHATPPRRLDVARLRQVLQEQGALIEQGIHEQEENP